MTPDVSGVFTAFEKALEPCPSPVHSWNVEPIQQAAEQACYRYCRRVLDEIWSYGVGEQPRRVYIERARLEQLIAASG